ncbi:MAG: DUF4147 domain-containing protein [Erysipelotrichales bacterium]|nr:DUF4147 domain-containing protein [Erysipelotrichales bacterium]
MKKLRQDAQIIMEAGIRASLADEAVYEALSGFHPGWGKTILIAVGKAAWDMANAAFSYGIRIDEGIVLTKHKHSKGPLPRTEIYEAGHPVPDEFCYPAARRILEITSDLTKDDTVLFLVSGGASALFEYSSLPLEELQRISSELLKCGASIDEINTVRKRLSLVKGGRFGAHCAPAKVFAVLLCDVLSGRADIVGSGPAAPDQSTVKEAEEVLHKYGITLNGEGERLLHREPVTSLPHCTNILGADIRRLMSSAEKTAESLGYKVLTVPEYMTCEAKDAGQWMAEKINVIAKRSAQPVALIAGGETVVKVTGNGLGGRNQEIALSAARYLDHIPACVFSFGSDGTDGPTDAAGGYIDPDIVKKMRECGIDPAEVLARNDSYRALEKAGGLLITGPTGTNVNDLTCALYWPLSPLDAADIQKDDPDITEIRGLYERAFPSDERMPWEILLQYLDEDRTLTKYSAFGKPVGFTYTYRTEDMIYLGYFAVEEDDRHYGCGQEILAHLIGNNPGKRIIIDIEKEDENDPVTVTRKNFYRHAGFHDTDVAYRFYGVDYELMVYGGTASKEDWDLLARRHWGKNIRRPVYYDKEDKS